ncbi:hypothetical protein BKK79_06090 [Cupriavidus sp. USMAA2-4]|uniref:DUF2029 domain-containing protein n=1 Tax=Cupriavidus malaysiensis TaxID=367825 RepID=A0ABM6F234_9BURK|nr:MULTISPECIES: glycosyltransferase family 87 protein [Cupriavidus]AOY91434.1 hypothetical protein BKK79_06090 [Cupriavidus sp. USMAA2-4]AOZ05419.1 hypothetical protein BKK80_06065 [Cupriavidus malaysiensis]
MQAGQPIRTGDWLSGASLRAGCSLVLALYAAFVLSWAWLTRGFTLGTVLRPGTDFSVFWSAGHLALQGEAAAAYDYTRLQPVIAAYGALADGASFDLPWLYPPAFLLWMAPLAALPFALAYVVFIGGSGWAYVAGLLRLQAAGGWSAGVARWLPVVACPGFVVTGAMGQNAFLTAALALWAVLLLERRPVIAGMLAGALCIKPQLAVLLPLALLAAREWRALAVAAATALLMTLLAACVFGWDTLPAFLSAGARAKHEMLEHSDTAWYAMPTALALARLLGASAASAYLAQGISALAAAAAVAYVWRRQAGPVLRAGALGVGTTLATPYLWYYDLSWLGIALVALAALGMGKGGWLRGERLLLLAGWLLPLYLFVNRGTRWPQCGVLVLVLVLLAVLRRARAAPVCTGRGAA